ncbi:subtilase family protein [Leeuwenhoekiella aestuarii]|uniref:Subtilase family protein n=1 Tax=Leeuwenhoekiella aestuarii TaxID=2249426 RepID=A0A4Q0NYR5_9FLAO|nr:S8 family peptidase [Leeuwenhoekiella aestuarii]RXG17957.1 subtilase family protein [Leeuwenhoekiella aestuarii]RXG19286.1 subtilase family protein [Leeuwenhoekiella aestuarii]
MKRIFLAALSAALLMSSCDTTAPLISIPAENVDQLPLKVSDLSEDQLKDWPAKDIQKDTIPGMSVEKTYDELIKGKGASVIVAVVDSGVDIEHEDLKAVIWTNTDEIPGNGIDDDKNGYIDDVHGWNFLGDIVQEQLEKSRIVQKYDAQFKGKTLEQIPSAQKELFKTYTKAKKEVETEKEELIQQKTQYEQILAAVKSAHTAVSQKLGKEDYTAEEVEALEAATDMEQRNKAILTQMLNYEDTIPEFITMIGEQLESMTDRLNNNYNLNGNYRAALGDNPDDIKDTNYGNNNVIGPDPESAMHGTHVAGIIAAERNNGIGMNGVANNVQIMSVRAVPDGDERDKDIALAIRYAVDNGAKVINTSFGKYFATNPEWVYDAIKYAAKKDVLIVNAAGNEGIDLDNGDTVYPNDQLDNVTEFADNVISVGALNDIYGGKLVASFSNYGKSNVDVFAPGVQIWSTVPGNEYRFLQGTSMASPEVAGVAAMLRSYYPQFSAAQIKQIIMQTGVSTNIQVAAGGDAENVKSFSSLSKSGKMVNMYNAFKMAELSSKN